MKSRENRIIRSSSNIIEKDVSEKDQRLDTSNKTSLDENNIRAESRHNMSLNGKNIIVTSSSKKRVLVQLRNIDNTQQNIGDKCFEEHRSECKYYNLVADSRNNTNDMSKRHNSNSDSNPKIGIDTEILEKKHNKTPDINVDNLGDKRSTESDDNILSPKDDTTFALIEMKQNSFVDSSNIGNTQGRRQESFEVENTTKNKHFNQTMNSRNNTNNSSKCDDCDGHIGNHKNYTTSSTKNEGGEKEVERKNNISNIETSNSNENTRTKGIDYATLHGKNITTALINMTRRALVQSKQSNLNAKIVLNRVKFPLPRGLQKRFKQDAKIDIGGQEIIVKNKLGSGSYGTVILCSLLSSPQNNIAMKVQEEPRSLAWEYEILNKIENRIKKQIGRGNRKESYNAAFPAALTFTMFSDGATMGMTPGSCTGLNLLDIVNTHKGSVPELLAIHYTSRMLKHIETLHLKAKVLVSKTCKKIA